jgi:hypothetical protein
MGVRLEVLKMKSKWSNLEIQIRIDVFDFLIASVSVVVKAKKQMLL